jgi:hypothetical protein
MCAQLQSQTPNPKPYALNLYHAGALFMSYLIGTVAGMLNKSSADARRSEEFRMKVAHLDG